MMNWIYIQIIFQSHSMCGGAIHFIGKESKIFDQEYRIIEYKEIIFSIQINEFEQISIIPALLESTGKIAKTDKEKAEMLVSWFSQPPQPPSYSEETKEHYQLVEDEITALIDMNKDEEMSCYPLWDEYQMDITEEEIIEALRYISSHKAQGPDNIHNQMIKNGGNFEFGVPQGSSLCYSYYTSMI
ncbi:hypothetical protein RFI_29259 [Reticulomyxa filosa]|uniref:Uncharacterized protein n=1 Tax=Reticulomyxa filosa TaxID=46433 RepID=X6M519_RETFI|nr:hypothetical protein RFI_29259 [Reticulomyxa filosa]|eukprot:ETO08130.1 hypothetical protein RFI_29259 [Reticulomyxa filosa]